jgi:hypothetical protein
VVRSIVEIGFGLVYLIGALFNCLYTWRHGAEFYGGFAARAVWPPARGFVASVVIPRAAIFTGILVGFQALVGLSILSRGALVTPALVAGALFCIGAALVSSLGGAIANMVMACVQIYLALAR